MWCEEEFDLLVLDNRHLLDNRRHRRHHLAVADTGSELTDHVSKGNP